jgi:hypothetical protein
MLLFVLLFFFLLSQVYGERKHNSIIQLRSHFLGLLFNLSSLQFAFRTVFMMIDKKSLKTYWQIKSVSRTSFVSHFSYSSFSWSGLNPLRIFFINETPPWTFLTQFHKCYLSSLNTTNLLTNQPLWNKLIDMAMFERAGRTTCVIK